LFSKFIETNIHRTDDVDNDCDSPFSLNAVEAPLHSNYLKQGEEIPDFF